MIQNELKTELIYIGDKDPNLLDFIEKLILIFQNQNNFNCKGSSGCNS